MIYNYLKNLINVKFYATKMDAEIKVDVFYAANKLNDEQYAELVVLINDKYVAA